MQRGPMAAGKEKQKPGVIKDADNMKAVGL